MVISPFREKRWSKLLFKALRHLLRTSKGREGVAQSVFARETASEAAGAPVLDVGSCLFHDAIAPRGIAPQLGAETFQKVS
jgi:hypothetical protein